MLQKNKTKSDRLYRSVIPSTADTDDNFKNCPLEIFMLVIRMPISLVLGDFYLAGLVTNIQKRDGNTRTKNKPVQLEVNIMAN